MTSRRIPSLTVPSQVPNIFDGNIIDHVSDRVSTLCDLNTDLDTVQLGPYAGIYISTISC